MVHICSHDGCGFTAVEMPRFPWGCLLVSVYLKDSVGTRRQPNGEILQEICAIVKPYRNFIIMGDWNSSPQEIANWRPAPRHWRWPHSCRRGHS